MIYTDTTTKSQLNRYNDALNTVDACKLKFEYNDIKYLIVPNSDNRSDLIKYIMSLDKIDDTFEKCELISKIIVLSELEEDV